LGAMTAEFEERIRKRIDEMIDAKRFDEAAVLAVRMAFLKIPPKELVELLLKAIREAKEQMGMVGKDTGKKEKEGEAKGVK
jgi:hypothetical protein